MSISDRRGPEWNCTGLQDMREKDLAVGDEVAKAFNQMDRPVIMLCKITAIRDGKVYLDDSKVPLQFPGRLLKL